MGRDYDTAPAVAMGIGPEFGADNLLHVEFFKRPVLDVLLSYGWRPDDVDKFTIPANHPRRAELEAAGRIVGPDPENRGMLVVSRAEEPHYREVEFVRVMRRGDDPADVMANMPEVALCDHPAGKPCPAVRGCYKNRFLDRYNRWKAGQDSDRTDGFPLEEVPFVDSARRAELAHRNVRTAEQFLELPADMASKVPGYSQLAERVRRFLTAVKGQREDEKLDAKLAERDERIAALERQLRERDEPRVTPAARKRAARGHEVR